MADWKIGEAKQSLSRVVRLAAKEPQIIHNRDRVVAAVIGSAEAEPYLAWRAAQRKKRDLGAMLAELREICTSESYTLHVPPRADRKNAMTTGALRAARRHERHK